MTSAALPDPATGAEPDREQERLQALEAARILDTPPEEAFDRLTRLAARLTGSPTALVGLIGADRHFIKSSFGIPDDAPREQPRANSFCEHVVLSGMPLIVTNAAADERVCMLPAVREIGLAAYAGMPLITSDGHTLGSFCVTDTKPRIWSEADLEVVRDLAAAASTEIELRIAAEEVRRREAKLRLFAEQLPVVAWTTDRDLRITSVYGSLAAQLVPDPAALLGRDLVDLLSGGDFRTLHAHRRALAGSPAKYEYMLGPGYFDVLVEPLRDETCQIEGTIGFAVDISQRRSAEAQLEMYGDVVSHMDVGVYVFHLEDPDDAASLRVIEANAGAVRATGVPAENVIGLRIYDAFPDQAVTGHAEVYRSVALGGPPVDLGEVEQTDPRFRRGTFSIRAFPLPGGRAGVTIVNITENRKLQEQLRQSQKMEAVGQLAGGIAHDFNNLLLAMGGYTELALSHVDDGPRIRHELEEVQRACERAGSLTHQLLAFSRRQMLQPRAIDVNEIVGGSERLLRRLIGEDIDVVTTLEPALRTVKADPGQLEQVLVNLAVNARDAMRGGGKLELTTANVFLDEDRSADLWHAPVGEYVTITVRDSGSGMDEAVQARVFEPFFTTKEVGQGTGLGLSTAYGIVKQSGGYIDVASKPGAGSTFTIYLPAVEEKVRPETDARPAPVVGGRETILVVEDEPVVRNLVCEILSEQGYDVHVYADPTDALTNAEPESADLLVTDVVMPKLNGRELAERLTERNPRLKVIYVSGYTRDALLDRGVSDDEVAFLQKPFTVAELGNKVRSVLAA